MILVTGGAGYIGSLTNKQLTKLGYETILYDNLVCGHKELAKWGKLIVGDLSDRALLRRTFEEHPIDAVIHFAAYAYVGESVGEPAKYYANNVGCTLNLLEEMRRHHCDKIVFSSSCATYGIPDCNPITEDMPQNPINPYGRTKLMIEQILRDYDAAYGLKYMVLRYFNACGADPECEVGEWHVPETHLIPIILEACAGERERVTVFGTDYATPDGTCIRDYVHVHDLARAHLQALEYLLNGGGSDCINLGNQRGYSVSEVIEAAKKVTGKDIMIEIAGRRPGDPDELIGSNRKAGEVLGWKPVYSDIEMILLHAWDWQNASRSMRAEQ